MLKHQIELRKVNERDRDNMLTWRNSDQVRPYMYTSEIISREEHNRWFSSMLKDETKKYWVILCDKREVGAVNLTNIDRNNLSCDWAFYIFDSDTRGKGVGTFVEKFIIFHVFEEMNFEKLNCEVLESNMPVVRMHEKFGFKQEGFFRNMIKRKVFLGVYRLSMIRSDYYDSIKIKTKLEKDLDVITQIQNIRSKNNINWMDMLRLALTENPTAAKKIIFNINSHDNKISQLVRKLSEE